MGSGRRGFESVNRKQIQELDATEAADMAQLTEREEYILRMLQAGYSREDIAHKLGLSKIETDLYSLRDKLNDKGYILLKPQTKEQ